MSNNLFYSYDKTLFGTIRPNQEGREPFIARIVDNRLGCQPQFVLLFKKCETEREAHSWILSKLDCPLFTILESNGKKA